MNKLATAKAVLYNRCFIQIKNICIADDTKVEKALNNIGSQEHIRIVHFMVSFEKEEDHRQSSGYNVE